MSQVGQAKTQTKVMRKLRSFADSDVFLIHFRTPISSKRKRQSPATRYARAWGWNDWIYKKYYKLNLGGHDRWYATINRKQPARADVLESRIKFSNLRSLGAGFIDFEIPGGMYIVRRKGIKPNQFKTYKIVRNGRY